MANILSQLPVQFIITALNTNPDAQSFPWNGKDISRAELLAEIGGRPLPASASSLAGQTVGILPITDADRKKPKK